MTDPTSATSHAGPAVRAATAADLPAVAAIYTHYVLRTTTTFATEVRSPRAWRERYEQQVASGPYQLLVAEVDRRVAGYVETLPFRPKPAYDRSVELSVYVAPDATGGGIGRALYAAVLAELESDPRFHRAYAVVALPNDASLAFHGRLGFVHRGTLTEAGHKFGRYLDVAYLERDLSGSPDPYRPGGPPVPSTSDVVQPRPPGASPA